jgi:hypothetical protein
MKATRLILIATFLGCTLPWLYGQEQITKTRIPFNKLDSLERDYYRWFKGISKDSFILYHLKIINDIWSIDSTYRLRINNESVYPFVNGKLHDCTDDIGLYKRAKVTFTKGNADPVWGKEYQWLNNRARRVEGRILSRYGGIVALYVSDTSVFDINRYDIEYPIWGHVFDKRGHQVFMHEPRSGFGFVSASDSGDYLIFEQQDNWRPQYFIVNTINQTIDTFKHEDVISADDAGYLSIRYTPEIGKVISERINIDSLRQRYLPR